MYQPDEHCEHKPSLTKAEKEEMEALLRLYEQGQNNARVDELKNRLKVQFIPSHWERLRNETNSWARYVDRRIGQLEEGATHE